MCRSIRHLHLTKATERSSGSFPDWFSSPKEWRVIPRVDVGMPDLLRVVSPSVMVMGKTR
jgi:hypothetical protein